MTKIIRTRRSSKVSLLTVYALLITVFIIIIESGYWKKPYKVIRADVAGYYAYLPSLFIYKDITTETIPIEVRKKVLWALPAPNGTPVFKFTMGMSILYAPFFFLAHLYALASGDTSMGFGAPYQFALIMSSFIFLIIGLVYLRKLLKRYFSDKVTAVTLVVVTAGTNLLYYSALRATVTHTYNFALFTLFIYYTIQWYKNPGVKISVILGLLSGIISLVRPSNTLIVLFFIFYGLKSGEDRKNRIALFLKQYKNILIILFFTFLVWVPQVYYWKTLTGKFFYYSYTSDEGFFFGNPQIISSLFSYHNGWLLYTPLMALALAGIPLLYFRHRDFFRPVTIFMVVFIYVLSSWWCWWFVGFGNRAYIESYALLAFPFAELLTAINENRRKLLRFAFYLMTAFLLFLNSFQVWQYSHNMGHYDGMTKESYWYLFLNNKARGKFYQLIKRPDYQKARQGIYEFKKQE